MAVPWQQGRSDLDFLVEFLPEASDRIFAGNFEFKEVLEQLVQCKIDLVMAAGIRNPFCLKAALQ